MQVDAMDLLSAANPVPAPLAPPPFRLVTERAALRRRTRARGWVGRHLVVVLGTLVVTGTATSGVAVLTTQPRQHDARVVDFDPARPGSTAELAGIPLPPDIDDPNRGLIPPDGSMRQVPDGQARLDSAVGAFASKAGVEVLDAVERRPDDLARAVGPSGLVRVNYQAEARYRGARYRIEVLQPSVADAARGIEGPGDRVEVDGITAYVARSAPDESWATSFVADGLFVAVSSKTSTRDRLVVARALGWVR